MSESLTAQLWQLSEAGEPAIFLGRLHCPHESAMWERLLELGVLRHEAPATSWDTCEACDCGADERPVRWLEGTPVAICPTDHARDERLDPEDVQSFRISVPDLVTRMAEATGLSGPIEEITTGVWRLGVLPDGRVLIVVPTRGAIARPTLIGSLRLTDPGRGIVLLGPALGSVQRADLTRQGVQHAVLQEMACVPEPGRLLAIDLSGLSRECARVPRLVLSIGARAVSLEGRQAKLRSRCFELLLLLARHLKEGRPIVSVAAIHDELFSPSTAQARVRGLVKELRDQIGKHLRTSGGAADLVETRSNIGYAIALSPTDVRIDP